MQYKSPSVWAWRQGRVKKIKKATDLVLTLYPFETEFLEKHSVNAEFVGHPLADMIPFEVDKNKARRALNIPITQTTIALLPGSRSQEVNALAETFLATAKWCQERCSQLQFVVPCANSKIRDHLQGLLQKPIFRDLTIALLDGKAHEAMAACDVVLMALGTETLEAALLKRPMVVAYRMSELTYQIAKRLIKVPYISLPNLLSDTALVPEFIQHDISVEKLGKALLERLNNTDLLFDLKQNFLKIHKTLQRRASQQAASKVLALIG